MSVQVCHLNSNNESKFKVQTIPTLKNGIKDMFEIILSLRAGDFPPKANSFTPRSSKPISPYSQLRVNKYNGNRLFGKPSLGTLGKNGASGISSNGASKPPGAPSEVG